MGTWDPDKGLNMTKDYTKDKEEIADNLKNTTLIVTTILVGILRNCV